MTMQQIIVTIRKRNLRLNAEDTGLAWTGYHVFASGGVPAAPLERPKDLMQGCTNSIGL